MRKTLLIVALVSIVGAAHAQDSGGTTGTDEVALKNGGSVRGTIVSSDPGVSVKIIELGATEARTIPWSEVANVERDKFASRGANGASTAVSNSPPPPPPQDSPPAMGALGVVRLHVDSPVPVQISTTAPTYGTVNGRDAVFTLLTPMCMSPCDILFDGRRGKELVASGDFHGREKFNTAGMTGDVELSVRPGNQGLRMAGWASEVLGSVGLGLGITMAAVGSSGSFTTETGPTGFPVIVKQTNDSLTTAGIAVAVTGGVLMVAGLVAIITTGTQFDLHPKAVTPSARTPRYWLGEF